MYIFVVKKIFFYDPPSNLKEMRIQNPDSCSPPDDKILGVEGLGEDAQLEGLLGLDLLGSS